MATATWHQRHYGTVAGSRRKVARETGVPGLVLVGLDRVEDVALDVALVGFLIGPEVQTSIGVRLRVPEPALSGDLLDERPDDCVFGPGQEARDGDARRIRSDVQESLDRRT